MDAGPGDQPDLSLAVLDLAVPCPPNNQVPGNFLANPSFETNSGMAVNGGQPPSSIVGWDGCCNLDGQGGQNTTWTVSTAATHCGQQSVYLMSNDKATGNVFNQHVTIDGAGGKAFRLTAWVMIRDISPGAQLKLDLYDLTGMSAQASPPLTAPTGGWTQLSVMGTMPQGPSPSVQARIYDTGKMTAFVDDVFLVLP